MLQVETVKVGDLQTNCYIIKKHNQCLVVDPGDEIEKIKASIGNCQVVAVLLTHHHFDHVGALQPLLHEFAIPLYDFEHVSDNEQLFVGPFHFQVLYTKGHSSTSITFYFEESKMMFVGDFVFKESIGRTDLESGSDEEMIKSIQRLKKYKTDIILYPGHGDSTTLNYEKKYNPYF